MVKALLLLPLHYHKMHALNRNFVLKKDLLYDSLNLTVVNPVLLDQGDKFTGRHENNPVQLPQGRDGVKI